MLAHKDGKCKHRKGFNYLVRDIFPAAHTATVLS